MDDWAAFGATFLGMQLVDRTRSTLTFRMDDLRQRPRTAAAAGACRRAALMTSFYARTPSNFFVEYGWGGRSIDPDTWKPVEMT